MALQPRSPPCTGVTTARSHDRSASYGRCPLEELLEVRQDGRAQRRARVGGRVAVEGHRVDHGGVQPVAHAQLELDVQREQRRLATDQYARHRRERGRQDLA